jgi:hypothetical protein
MKVVQHAGAHRVKDDQDLIAELLRDLGIVSRAPGLAQ